MPLKCDEVEKTEGTRKEIEEKLTEAMIRECVRCNKKVRDLKSTKGSHVFPSVLQRGWLQQDDLRMWSQDVLHLQGRDKGLHPFLWPGEHNDHSH